MADFLPYYVSLNQDRAPSPRTPRRNTSSPPEADSEQRRPDKRKSMLSLAIQQVVPTKQHKTPPTSRVYSVSRLSDSLAGLSQQFRCDILATSSEDYRQAEAECKQLVIEAGGTIFEHLQYPGGFLFELSCVVECPLETGDKTAAGGTIVVELFDHFDGHHPVREIPVAHTPTQLSPHTPTSKTRSGKRLQKKIRPAPAPEPASPTYIRTNSHPRYLGFGTRRMTLNELLLEEAGIAQRRGVARHHEDADWETLSEEEI